MYANLYLKITGNDVSFTIFIEVTLVNEIYIRHLYILLCALPQVKYPFNAFDSLFIIFYLPHPLFTLIITILLSVSMSFSLLNPFNYFTRPQLTSLLTAVSLFSVTKSLFLFCLLLNFVH